MTISTAAAVKRQLRVQFGLGNVVTKKTIPAMVEEFIDTNNRGLQVQVETWTADVQNYTSSQEFVRSIVDDTQIGFPKGDPLLPKFLAQFRNDHFCIGNEDLSLNKESLTELLREVIEWAKKHCPDESDPTDTRNGEVVLIWSIPLAAYLTTAQCIHEIAGEQGLRFGNMGSSVVSVGEKIIGSNKQEVSRFKRAMTKLDIPEENLVFIDHFLMKEGLSHAIEWAPDLLPTRKENRIIRHTLCVTETNGFLPRYGYPGVSLDSLIPHMPQYFAPILMNLQPRLNVLPTAVTDALSSICHTVDGTAETSVQQRAWRDYFQGMKLRGRYGVCRDECRYPTQGDDVEIPTAVALEFFPLIQGFDGVVPIRLVHEKCSSEKAAWWRVDYEDGDTLTFDIERENPNVGGLTFGHQQWLLARSGSLRAGRKRMRHAAYEREVSRHFGDGYAKVFKALRDGTWRSVLLPIRYQDVAFNFFEPVTEALDDRSRCEVKHYHRGQACFASAARLDKANKTKWDRAGSS